MRPDQDLEAAYVIPKNHIDNDDTFVTLSGFLPNKPYLTSRVMGLSMERVDRQPPRMNGNSTSPSIPPGYSTPAAIWERVVEQAQTSKSKSGYGSEGSVMNLKDVRCPLSTHCGILACTFDIQTHFFGMKGFMNCICQHCHLHNIVYQSLICNTKWMMEKLLPPHPPTRDGQAVAHRLSWWLRPSNSRPLRCKTVKVLLLVFWRFTAFAFIFGFCLGPEFHTEEVATQGV